MHNELKKMNRSELIEIIYALQKEERRLKKRINELEEKLEDRRIIIDKAGSIAEASLRLNKIFEDAQKAADDYVLSVKSNYRYRKTGRQDEQDEFE
ncbi:hypothetical protein SAMN02910289_00549 [Lachnospiraceae bacterium RM5]|nr:hypothetical protein SAMN02910289_00549 [Lachnospiraceae bacterium RM5]